ncbi:MAG: hypothetical protein ACLQCB_10720 [Spirochaetia bacterium]
MTKGRRGTVVSVRPELREQRLKVVATVRVDSGETLEAHMPDREISAILPRSVLLGEARTAPVSLMDTVSPIISRMTEGRLVRVWQYKERWFFSFQQWKGVRFRDAEDQGPRADAAAAKVTAAARAAIGGHGVTSDPGQTATPA